MDSKREDLKDISETKVYRKGEAVLTQTVQEGEGKY